MLINYSNVEVCQGKQQILNDVNFCINEGEFVYITGKVGTGKSSLLKTIYGEVPLDKGSAMVMDMNLIKCKKKKLPELRRKMGIIFQDFQLLTDRTVYSNLDFVLKATGWKIKSEREARIAQVLNRVGMKDKGDKLPSELSGGEQQRIAIARSILNHPALVLADEPTGNLDSETSSQITELLHKLVDEKGSTVIMITHNMQLIEKYPGRIFECVEGKLQEVKK